MAATPVTPDPAGLEIRTVVVYPRLHRHQPAQHQLRVLLHDLRADLHGFAQPYILTEILQIPEERQGMFTGNLAAGAEIFQMLVVGFFGAWSDRTGRRLVFGIGFALFALSYFPITLATSETELGWPTA